MTELDTRHFKNCVYRDFTLVSFRVFSRLDKWAEERAESDDYPEDSKSEVFRKAVEEFYQSSKRGEEK